MSEPQPRRRWWWKKRWWAVGVLWLAAVYAAGAGPAMYCWLRGYPGSRIVYHAYTPVWAMTGRNLSETGLGRYLFWWVQLALFHSGSRDEPPGPLWGSWRAPDPVLPPEPYVPDPAINRTHWTPPPRVTESTGRTGRRRRIRGKTERGHVPGRRLRPLRSGACRPRHPWIGHRYFDRHAHPPSG